MIRKPPYFLLAIFIEFASLFIIGTSNNNLINFFVMILLFAFVFIYSIYLIIFIFKLIAKLFRHKKSQLHTSPKQNCKVSHSETTNATISSSLSQNDTLSANLNVSQNVSKNLNSSQSNHKAVKESIHQQRPTSSSCIQYGVQVTPAGLSTINNLKIHPIKQSNTDLTIHHLRRKLFNFVVVDCETTGLSRNSKIIQLSAIRYLHDKPVETFDEYVNPGEPISANVTALTGIDDNMVANAPVFSKIKNKFATFVGTLPWVGHNINSFDIPVLINNGYPLKEVQTIDTLPLARKKLHMDSYGLENLKTYYGIQNGSHNALEDCKTTAVVYQHLRDDLITPVSPDYSSIPQTLTGKQFAISGSFPGYSRADVKEMIVSHGGVVKGVSHKTDYLIDGTQISDALTDGIHSSKELKARDYGIKFLSLSEFMKMAEDN